ncbi:MAG TPA: DUF1805 domain-containing protein [Methanoculleus sp.]|nr:DUF1805 domain-containing protein [Methanoculleus sp.]
MIHTHLSTPGITAECYAVPAGPLTIVFAVAEKGVLACGAIDPAALQTFGLATARVRPPEKTSSVASAKDLLDGTVKEANPAAEALGIRIGMSGAEALALLSEA